METIKVLDREFVPYIDHETIVSKIKEMAEKMNRDLRDKNPLFLGILNGSFMFAAELFNHLTIDCNISFLKLASYEGTNSTGKVKRLIGVNEDIKDRTVVIVEDIIDTGITMDHIEKQLIGYEPKEIKIATLLYKSEIYNNKYPIDYFCFDIPQKFIVGFGLDYDGYGRNLPHIYQETK
ncbi:MAG: hypoxanthine phosphoribosyltransferase [Bacteroidales bacterium]|nr:hypoxanthine phosphoribosyltransferase [Bacteroidales bacterium]